MRGKKGCYAILLMAALLLNEPQLMTTGAVKSPHSSPFHNGERRNAEGLSYSYDIEYDLNGGSVEAALPSHYIMEELPLTLEIPHKTGYNFAGWYTDDKYRNKIKQITIDELGDLSLHAKWTKEINSFRNVEHYSYITDIKENENTARLKDCGYSFVENIDIPGMPSTRENDYMKNLVTTEEQCPQGICITEDFCLITAYCSNDSEKLGSLYVFNKDNGEYLVTLGMKKNSHLGGLTFDGKNLWICHSDTRTLERLNYDYIKRIALSKPKMFVDATGMFKEYRVSNMPSAITYDDGLLWVATHNAYFKSTMIAYKYLDGGLVEQERYQIPEKVQGITFDEDGHVYLSTSFGRRKSSYVRMYESMEALDDKPGAPAYNIELPPCSEAVIYQNGKLYVLFESASLKYFEGTDGRGTSSSPIDKILVVETDGFF